MIAFTRAQILSNSNAVRIQNQFGPSGVVRFNKMESRGKEITSSVKVLANQVNRRIINGAREGLNLIIYQVQGITLNKENYPSHLATSTHPKQVYIKVHVTAT